MSNISKIKINDVVYEVKDILANEQIELLKEQLDGAISETLEDRGIFLVSVSFYATYGKTIKDVTNEDFIKFNNVLKKMRENYKKDSSLPRILFVSFPGHENYQLADTKIFICDSLYDGFYDFYEMYGTRAGRLQDDMTIRLSYDDNDNLTEFKYTNYTHSRGKVLTTRNSRSFTPTDDYHPVHKKYVDDSIASALGDINTVLSTLTTVNEVNE